MYKDEGDVVMVIATSRGLCIGVKLPVYKNGGSKFSSAAAGGARTCRTVHAPHQAVITHIKAIGSTSSTACAVKV